MLSDFRSYGELDLAIGGRLVVLCGENGAGKTNLLEALSLFAPGRGLRRAELQECARVGGAGGFALSIEIEADGETHQLGSGWKRSANGDEAERLNRIDRAAVASSRAQLYYNRGCALEQKVPSLVLLVCQYEIGNSFYRVFSILHLSWGGVDRSTIVFICRIGSAGNRGELGVKNTKYCLDTSDATEGGNSFLSNFRC